MSLEAEGSTRTEQPLDPTQAGEFAKQAAQQTARLQAELKEAQQRQALAEARRVEAEQREAAEQARRQEAKAAFLKRADALMDKKVGTARGFAELLQDILVAQREFHAAAGDTIGSGPTNIFCRHVTQGHATSAVVLWLQPLLMVKKPADG